MPVNNSLTCFFLIAGTGLALAGCNPGTGTATTPSTSNAQAAAAEPAESSVASATDAPSSQPAQTSLSGEQAAEGVAAIDAGVVKLAPDNTTIQFVGTHVGDEPRPRTGVFTKFSGTAKVDPESKKLQAVAVDIDTESLVTPIEKLTNHLKSPDFFDVREYPKARFESTKIVAGKGEGEYVVTGNLTLRKVTKEISFPAKVKTSADGLALDSKLTIDRTDFDLGAGQDGVNKEVEISVWVGKKTTPPTE